MHVEGSYHHFFGCGKGVCSYGPQCCCFDENDPIAVSLSTHHTRKSFHSYSGATSLFMTVLLNKKYSLPYVLLDQLVAHFLSFLEDDRELPVLWQQV